MKKIAAAFFVALLTCSVILVSGTLYAGKQGAAPAGLREAITWDGAHIPAGAPGVALKLSTRLTQPSSPWQTAMHRLSEWGLPTDWTGDSKSLALTGLLLAVFL
ncbi:MAG: hypothetical protein HQL88_01820 [Magnetococcales bacterium]|nr:hypothetical protein [Magnetococcales bacterium]